MGSPLRYDAVQRRLWISGQRCHHGATGAVLAALGCALMLHDWGDRGVWFRRGPVDSPFACQANLSLVGFAFGDVTPR